MTTKLWQTPIKVLCLVPGMWPWCLVTALCMLGTCIICCSSFLPKSRMQGCVRAYVPECWGHVFDPSAHGNICKKTGAGGNGNNPDCSRAKWDAQTEPAHLV